MGRQIPVRHGPPNPGVSSVHPVEQSFQLQVMARKARSFMVQVPQQRRMARHTLTDAWAMTKAVLALMCAMMMLLGLFVCFVYIQKRYGE